MAQRTQNTLVYCIRVSQSSVSTRLRWGGLFNDSFIANCPQCGSEEKHKSIFGKDMHSPKCLRFGHWLTLCTLNIHLLTYLLTYTLESLVARFYGSRCIGYTHTRIAEKLPILIWFDGHLFISVG